MTKNKFYLNDKVSQETSEKFHTIIGLDLSSSGVFCSYISDKDNPCLWTEKSSMWLPASVLYKNWHSQKDSTEIKYKAKTLKPGPTDVQILNIKAHVFDLLKQDNESDGPSKEQIMCDLLTEIKSRINESDVNFRQVTNPANDGNQSCNTSKCRFIFSIPDGLGSQSTKYMELVHGAFLVTGLIDVDDQYDRLIFVTDAVAAGYACLGKLKLSRQGHHMVCDIGYSSVNVAIIKIQPTDEMSVIRPLGSSVLGYMRIESLFEEFISKSNYSETDTQKVVHAFRKYNKALIEEAGESTDFGGIAISNSDIIMKVFKPFTDSICNLIRFECDANNISNIIFCGKYSSDPYFGEQYQEFLKSFNLVPSVVKWSDNFGPIVSQGAATFGLRVQESQIPAPSDSFMTAENKQTTNSYIHSGGKVMETNLSEGSYVIGFDFGTTYSGCSYADVSGSKSIETKIEHITDWAGGDPYPKAPTALLYSEEKKKIVLKKWGHGALKSRDKKHVILKHFKLLLSEETLESYYGKGEIKKHCTVYSLDKNIIENSKNEATSQQSNLRVLDIIAEYLHVLNEKAITVITGEEKKKTGLKKKSLNFRYVITVPAMWSFNARSLMVQAAIQAGLIKSDQADLLWLITEPEAAAISCNEFMQKNFGDFVRNDTFIVCDAGGGTVDLVTFQKSEVMDDKQNPIPTIKQIGDGIGGTCGSAYLDLNFRKYITKVYNTTLGINPPKEFIDFHEQFFEKKIKNNFGSKEEKNEYTLDLRNQTVKFIPISKETKEHFKNGDKCFTITKKCLQKNVFDPVVDKVCDLIDIEISKIAKPGDLKNLAGILMVGGFSNSKYLLKKISSHCSRKGIRNVKKPGTESEIAISKGAVLYYLEPCLVTQKIANTSFALHVQKSDPTTDYLLYFVQQETIIATEAKKYSLFVSFDHPHSAILAIFSEENKNTETQKKLEAFNPEAKKLDKITEFRFTPKDLKSKGKIELVVSLMLKMGAVTVEVELRDGKKDSKQFSCKTIETPAISFTRVIPTVLENEHSLKVLKTSGFMTALNSKRSR